ncbi:MAG: substrate-binding domain-containing protein [Phototrophicaceae bacterium]
MPNKLIVIIMMMLAFILSACGTDTTSESGEAPTQPVNDDRLILATTTSTHDSGLLDAILPSFEAQFGVTVDVVAVGTGQALALGEAGDADVLLVHAREREDAFVDAGYGSARFDVMFNDFVIIGAADDPAEIAGKDATEAFIAIANAEARFVSRGDDSGTHSKELSIWESATITPEGDWYQAAGQSMGAVIMIANEQQAYTLTDRATYIALATQGLDLVVLVEGDAILNNPYGVIPVSTDANPTVNAQAANLFVQWLLSLETQEMIAAYEVEGQQLFFPDSEAYRAAHSD